VPPAAAARAAVTEASRLEETVSADRPLRVAVVGSGPAGFYACAHLLAADPPVEVDMIERLPTPWGLVRLGVAPDHPNIKAVSKTFEKIAQRPGFRFLGNVDIGRDLEHEELVELYDAVIYSVGAQTDRRMGIPGEDLPGSYAATEFVAWYNGHPDFQELEFDLSCERAIVVGNGNVAIDVARMLALTDEELVSTDTTDEAIEAIAGSGLREILMLGRRGPAQASFTTPELKELGELAGADVVVDPAQLELEPASEPALAQTLVARNLEVLREYAGRPPSGKPRRLELRFRASPVAILGDAKVEAVEIVRNELVADENGRVRAIPTDEREIITCGIVFRSVGYQGVPIPRVPFDEERCTLRNEGGRVLDEHGERVQGVYCAGWIKRGPTGIIGTNKKDATETVDNLLEDAAAGLLRRPEAVGAAEIDGLLAERGVDVVTYAGWEAIDAVEKGRGEPLGRPRVKLLARDELLSAAGSAKSAGRLGP
jgi:ferredoxin/flavodoxin---NADP+ reductase